MDEANCAVFIWTFLREKDVPQSRICDVFRVGTFPFSTHAIEGFTCCSLVEREEVPQFALSHEISKGVLLRDHLLLDSWEDGE